MDKTLSKTRLLLLGGSLTHICFLNTLSRREMEHLKIILITPFLSFYYQEMAAGYLEGIFSEENVQIDISTLCERKGVHLIIAQPVKIDAENKRVVLEDGRNITYDILSLDLAPFGQYIEGLSYYGMAIHYDDNLQKVKQYFQKRSIESNVTIVGAGKLGVEIALALRSLADANHQNLNITLIEGAQTLLPGYDIEVKKMVHDRLRQHKIDLLLGRNVIRVTGDLLVFNDHSVLEYGYLIWTAIANRYPLLDGSGLLMDERGRVVVGPTLQIEGHEIIFACGESAVIQNSNQFFSSTDPAKEGEALLRNIIKTIQNVPLLQYIPQEAYQGNIYLGKKRAINQHRDSISKGFLVWHFRKTHNQKLIRKLQNR
jgi:selenide,water dikinase